MQQHLIAQNYPGLLDGIITSLSYPDTVTVIPGIVDCSLARPCIWRIEAVLDRRTADGCERILQLGHVRGGFQRQFVDEAKVLPGYGASAGVRRDYSPFTDL